MTKHTAEPWHVETLPSGEKYIWSEHQHTSTFGTVADMYCRNDQGLFAFPDAESNAARIVACVNALAGIDDPAEFVARADRAGVGRSQQRRRLRVKINTELEWTTAAGLPATIKYIADAPFNVIRLFIDGACGGENYRCGYVDVPPVHPLHGSHYDDVPADVHGGLTYAEANGGAWRFGFDCSHHGDTEDVCTLEYVKAECEKLAAFLSK